MPLRQCNSIQTVPLFMLFVLMLNVLVVFSPAYQPRRMLFNMPLDLLFRPIKREKPEKQCAVFLMYANEVAEVLIRSRFTFRTIWLGGSISSTHRLLAVSSETLVTLVLDGL